MRLHRSPLRNPDPNRGLRESAAGRPRFRVPARAAARFEWKTVIPGCNPSSRGHTVTTRGDVRGRYLRRACESRLDHLSRKLLPTAFQHPPPSLPYWHRRWSDRAKVPPPRPDSTVAPLFRRDEIGGDTESSAAVPARSDTGILW